MGFGEAASQREGAAVMGGVRFGRAMRSLWERARDARALGLSFAAYTSSWWGTMMEMGERRSEAVWFDPGNLDAMLEAVEEAWRGGMEAEEFVAWCCGLGWSEGFIEQ